MVTLNFYTLKPKVALLKCSDTHFYEDVGKTTNLSNSKRFNLKEVVNFIKSNNVSEILLLSNESTDIVERNIPIKNDKVSLELLPTLIESWC